MSRKTLQLSVLNGMLDQSADQGGSIVRIFSYRDAELYSHHSVDEVPVSEDFSMHAHEWMEVFYFVSGKASYLVEGNAYPLHPHDILILRSAEAHMLMVSPDEPYERITIHFAPSLLSAFDPEGRLLRPFWDRPLGRLNHYPASADPQGRLRSAFELFTFDGVPDVRLNLVARLVLFLTHLNGLYQQTALEHTPALGLQNQLVDYVNQHLFDDISVQTVADRFYRSRSQISRLFRQATGCSLWEYVTLKRLLAARAMIQRGENAGEACVACGFSDYSSFFRAYRTQFGHTPKDDSPQK